MVIQLIAKDKNEKFQFQGNCKLVIDSLSKLLLIEPYNENFKMISAMFKWEFVARKNILFVFAEYDFQDFAIIFDNSEKCNKAYGFLVKKGATVGNKELISQRFLSYIFNEISSNNESNLKIKEIFLKWIEFFDGKEKEELIQILKENNVYDLFYSNNVGELQKNHRKRKAKDITNQKESKFGSISNRLNNQNLKKRSSDKQTLPVLSKIIEAPNFEILKYVQNDRSRIKLSIFPDSNDRKYCYEYFWQKSKRYYVCHKCRHRREYLNAKIIKKNGKDVVELNETQHVCKLREYKNIIEKPDYEIISVESYKNVFVKTLFLFLDSSRDECYEYFSLNSENFFNCRGCFSKKRKTGAFICQKENGTAFILSISSQHVCEARKYNPEKYREKEIVETSNFRIFDDGKNKSKMVIFASIDRTFCYEYYWRNHNKKFLCCGCSKKKKSVAAKMCSYPDGKYYLKLNNTKHVCEPTEYDPDKFDPSKREIIESSNFKIYNYKHNGSITSRLIVFCKSNKNLCHEYFWNKKDQLFRCSYCLALKNHVTATVFKNDKGNENLILSKTQHVCNLLEFNVEKYKDDNIVKKEMYKFTSSALEKTKYKILVIFTNEQKRFYYKFVYSNQKKCYYCSKCYSSYKTFITAIIENEEKENECVFMSNEKHICEPLEYSTLTNGNIIMAPNFQFIKRKVRAKIHQHLIVFTNDEKSECYEYTWNEDSNKFKCSPCQSGYKISVYAKIFNNDENVECVELSEKPHKCKPIKFIPENITAKIVKQPDFKLYETAWGKKNVRKLAIFDSKNRKMGYIYSSSENEKKYTCCRCKNKRTSVTAKVLQDENGENYLELNDKEHVCEMQNL